MENKEGKPVMILDMLDKMGKKEQAGTILTVPEIERHPKALLILCVLKPLHTLFEMGKLAKERRKP